MEKILLPAVVSLPEHYVVSVGSVYIQVNLSDIGAVESRYIPVRNMLIVMLWIIIVYD